MAGLLRTPATVAIYRTRRTCARPPQIQRLPRIFPLSRLNGARPASAAICLRLSIPSSGNCASRVLESTLPTPGTERSNSSRSRHKGVSRINSASSASRPESRSSNQRMCSSMLRCKTLGARARRFFSAVSISINWRRRVTSASSAWACASANGRASGRTASPKRASTSASSRSVLASLPVARAKSRTCRGLTIATGIPAAARALATGVSRPPVASTITKSAGFICLSNSWIPTSSLATEKAPPADPMNTSSDTLATSIPTNRFTSSMFHPPQRGLPRLAIRDFFPLQPFGLSAIGVAATLAARRDLAPKGAPVCRSTNSDSSTKSSTYKGAEKTVVGAKFPFEFGFPPGCKRVEVKYIWCAEALYSAPESFRFGSERSYSVTLAVLQSRSGWRAHQITHPHQIVGRQCEGKHPAHSRHAAMTGLTQAGHGLEPAEDFFYPFTFLLTDRVARMASGAVIDDAGGLAGKMGSDLVVAQFLHKLLAVIAFVGPERDPLLPRNFFHHCDSGLPLGPAVGRGHSAIDRDTVAVLHQHVPRVAELGFLARTLTCQPRLGVGRRLMGHVAALLAMKVNRGIARVIGRALTTAVLALEAFVTRPRFDQRAVDREVLGREQAAAAGLRQHLGKEGLGNFGAQEPLAIFGEDGCIPHRIGCSAPRTSETADCSPVAPSACARCARYTAPAATAPAGVFRAESTAARLSHTWSQTADPYCAAPRQPSRESHATDGPWLLAAPPICS